MSQASNESKFHELSNELNDFERKNLLEKLTRSTDDKNGLKQSKKNDKKVSQKERDAFAQKVFYKKNCFTKLYYYLISFINGERLENVVIHKELENIQKEVSSDYPKLINHDDNRFNSSFIEKFIPLIKNINLLIDDFKAFDEEKVYYYDFLSHLFEKNLSPELLDLLDQAIPQNIENKKDYLDKSSYERERDIRIKKYFSRIEHLMYDSLDRQFKKIELFFRLLFFNYKTLLDQFFINDLDQPISSVNYTDITNSIILIEKFYKIISGIDYGYEELYIFDDFFEYFNIYPIQNKSNEKINLEFHQTTIRKLFDNIQDLKRAVPFKRIFQLVSGDLFYDIRPFSIQVNVTDLYKTYKKTLLMKMWENNYNDLRLLNIMSLLHELFKHYDFNSFDFFNRELKTKLEKFSQTKVFHFYTLNVLTEFIRKYYHNNIEIVINKIMIDGVFKREMIHSNLSTAYYILNSMYDKLQQFDDKFKQDNEWDKKITPTIRKAANDANFKSPLINLVNDLNEECNGLKSEIYESLMFITEFLKSLLDLESPSNIPITNFGSLRIPTYPNSYIACEKTIATLEKFFEVYHLVEPSFQ